MTSRLVAAILVLGGYFSHAQDSDEAGAALKAAQENYQATQAEKVDGPFESHLSKLTGQLDLALEREEERAIAAGDLDLVTAIRAERKSLLDQGAVLGSDTDGEAPELLKQFRQAWRKQKAQLESKRDAAARSHALSFAIELEELEKALTQERKIDEALAVRKHREQFAKSIPKVAATSPSSDAGDARSWITILDGASLEGWKTGQPRAFQKVSGGIRAGKPGSGKGGLLYYVGDDGVPDVFKNFEIKLRLYVDGSKGAANSGLFYHLSASAADRAETRANKLGGFEINLANAGNLPNQTGTIWDIKNVERPLRDQDKPFELVIRITADEISVVADGREIMSHDPSSGSAATYKPEGGAIAIQSNSTRPAYVFERIQIRRLE